MERLKQNIASARKALVALNELACKPEVTAVERDALEIDPDDFIKYPSQPPSPGENIELGMAWLQPHFTIEYEKEK